MDDYADDLAALTAHLDLENAVHRPATISDFHISNSHATPDLRGAPGTPHVALSATRLISSSSFDKKNFRIGEVLARW
jgi:hypothetical protein